MASLFEFTAGAVTIKKDLQSVAPFSRIIKKKNWEDDIAFIYHMADYSSPYAALDNEMRRKTLIEDIMGGREPSKDVEKGVEVYRRLSQTDSTLLLESARNAIRKLRDYFDTIDISCEEDPGKAAKDLAMSLKSVGDLINKIKEWDEIIKKEKESHSTRRGVVKTKYNT